MQARWARKTLKALALLDGRVTMDEQEIVQGVYYFFRDLYAKDPEVVENSTED